MVLWTHIVATATLANDTVSVDPSPEPIYGESLAPSGRLVDEGAPSDRHRRIDLLAYVVAGIVTSSMWIWLAVGLGVLGMSVGFLGLGATSMAALWTVPPASAGRSAFLLTGGLGFLYAVLTPPFQAPDEPHHFVAFPRSPAGQNLCSQARRVGRPRACRPNTLSPAERFSPPTLVKPGPVWEQPSAPDSSVRGGGVHVLWKAVAPLLRSMPAPRVFLALRLTQRASAGRLVGYSWSRFWSATARSPRLTCSPFRPARADAAVLRHARLESCAGHWRVRARRRRVGADVPQPAW